MAHSVEYSIARMRPSLRPLPRKETVGRGLCFAAWAVLAGVVTTVVVWRLGFVVFLVTLAMAVGAVVLYARGAGASPRRGLLPLVLLVLGGVVMSFLAVVASDAWEASSMVARSQVLSRAGFASQTMLDPVVLGSYVRDLVTSVLSMAIGLLAVLGPVRRSAGS